MLVFFDDTLIDSRVTTAYVRQIFTIEFDNQMHANVSEVKDLCAIIQTDYRCSYRYK